MKAETRALLAELLDEIRGLAPQHHSVDSSSATRAVLEALLQEGSLNEHEYQHWVARGAEAWAQSVAGRAGEWKVRRSPALSMGPHARSSGETARELSAIRDRPIGGGRLALTSIEPAPRGSLFHWKAAAIDVDDLLHGALTSSASGWAGVESLNREAREINRSDAGRRIPEFARELFSGHGHARPPADA